MSDEKKFYQMRLPDSEENTDVLNFIKNAKTSFNSAKVNFPRGQKSQADRAIWLMNYALENLAKENKIEGSGSIRAISTEFKKDKNELFSLLK